MPNLVALDRRRIRDQLAKTTEFQGLLGTIKFRQDREVTKPWLVSQVQGGKFVVQWIPPQFASVIKKS